MYSFILGIDISKNTLDAVLLKDDSSDLSVYFKAENTTEGITKLFKSIEKSVSFSIENCLICIEATGVYCYQILDYATKNDAKLWMENGTQIKKSIGIQRGKNDKVDAQRIAEYAFKNQNKARIWIPADQTVTQVKHLSTLRDRLVDTRKRLMVPVEEFLQVGDKKMHSLLEKGMKHSLEAIEKDIFGIEKKIEEIIDQDQNLHEIYSLLRTIVGIGPQTALALIVCTNGFKLFENARKLACYAGVAPFEYKSGTSVRGKTRVSKMANIKLKTALHMASLSAVKLDHQLKAYYERKVAEGKSKMAVLNAVKNKLIHRAISVVTRREKYENSLNFSLELS